MFESPECAHDETIVELTPDQQAVALEAAAEISGAAIHLHQMIEAGTLSVALRYACTGVIEHQLERLRHALGSISDDEIEAKLKANLLRQANLENHRLREEMAKGVTAEAITQALRPTSDIVYKWWTGLGFTYMQGHFEAWHGGGAFVATMSCHVDRHVSTFEDKPITAQSVIEKRLAEMARELVMVGTGSDRHVLDTPENRRWICQRLLNRFPNARWRETRSMASSELGRHWLREIVVAIPLTDIIRKDDHATAVVFIDRGTPAESAGQAEGATSATPQA